jgi:chemotaxis protein methyltransferase CheR
MLDPKTVNLELVEAFSYLIAQHSGIVVRQQDQASFGEKIFSRMQANKIKSQKKYYELLKSETPESSKEWESLTSLMVNNESYFFRDQEQLNILKNKILLDLIKRKKAEKTIRICSAGCSTGQEPYTLALMLKELLPDFESWNILILGIDIDRAALAEAEKGVYESWSFRGVAESTKKKYFQEINSQYHIASDIKKFVKFRFINLVKDEFPQHKSELNNMDLVLCRNVFIYFENSATAKVLDKIYKTLQPLGYFVSGHTELIAQNLSQFNKVYFPGSVVYQRPSKDELQTDIVNSLSAATIQKNISVQASHSAFISSQSIAKSNLASSLGLSSEASNVPSTHSEIIISSVNVEKILKEIENLLFQEKYELAITQIQQVLKTNSQNVQAHCYLAQVYANLGQYDVAVQCCQRGLEINSFDKAPYFLMAKIAEEQGNLNEAKRVLKQIIYLDPMSVEAYLDLSHIYQQEGDLQRSQKMQESAIEFSNNLPVNTKLR